MVIILPLFSGFTAIYKVHGAMSPVAYLNIGMLMAQVILTALVLLLGGGVLAALTMNVLTSAGQLVAAWWIYRREFYVPSPPSPRSHVNGERGNTPPLLSLSPLAWERDSSPEVSRVRGNAAIQMSATGFKPAPTIMPLLRRAFPFALAAFFAALQNRLSVILLERMATTTEVGYFSAASRFVEAARLIPNAFFGALFPALAAIAVDRLLLARTFQRGMLYLGTFGIAAGIGFSALGLPLLTLTYGGEFAPAALPLQVLGWSLLFGLLRGGRTLYLYALGQESRVNRVNGVVIALQAALSLLLISGAGALGVALAHVLIEIVGLVLLWRNGSTSG
jgi:O-antigen/teichoic acid export membrane protein